MFANLLDPVVRDYLFHDSPIHQGRPRTILGVVVAVLLLAALYGWTIINRGKTTSPLSWVPFTILGSVIGYFIIAFLDRERRIRLFHFVVLLCALFVSSPISAILNNFFGPIKLYTVGFVEEFFKVVPVLLLAIYVPNLIRTRKDGIVYGALAGMGFNIIEIGLYIAKVLPEYGLMGALYQQSTRFAFLGLGGHIITSAFVGLGIGYAAESTARGWQKWKKFVYYYLIAAVMHSAYDLGLSMVGVFIITGVETLLTGADLEAAAWTLGTVPGPFRDGMQYGPYIVYLGFIIVIVVQLRRSFAWEQTVQVEELTPESKDVITKPELEKLKAERLFFKRRYKELPKKTGNKIVFYQNLLAMQKHSADMVGKAVDQVAPVSTLRSAIRALR